MPNINSLTYNGMKSTDLGVYVTGSGSFDAAEMDADKYEIAGRNGDLIIPKNRYKNIVVTYPAFIPKAFQGKAQSIRNWMRSAKAYARLEDTYDMEHYRLGLASGIQSFEPVNRNDASNFQLNFDCRPERFLKTGETPLPIEPEAHSYSGEIVSFETVAVDDMTKAEVSLSPIQSLNGYEHPWAAGAGTNKCAFPSVDFTLKGVRYYTENGTLHMSGTSQGETSSGDPAFDALHFKLPAGTYYFSRFTYPNATYLAKVGGTTAIATNNGSFTLSEETDMRVGFYVYNKTFSGEAIPLSVTVGSTAPSAYTPAANLCPISGHTGATLKIGAEYPTADREYTSSFGQTVYGGTFDFVSGKLVANMAIVDLGTLTYTYMSLSGGRNAFVAHIDGIVPHASNDVPINAISSAYKAVSYNASWENGNMSYTRNATGGDDKQQVTFINNSYTDAAAFKTAMAGQTVCYELTTPIEIDLTPEDVETLLGLNNVWASDGTVEINYADPFNVDNPTYFEARPLFEITNPAQNDVLNVNGKTITFLSSYTGTVTIDCETMDCFSGYTNLNYLISATDFLVLNEGVNIVTWSGSGTCKMTPRWWEL